MILTWSDQTFRIICYSGEMVLRWNLSYLDVLTLQGSRNFSKSQNNALVYHIFAKLMTALHKETGLAGVLLVIFCNQAFDTVGSFFF